MTNSVNSYRLKQMIKNATNSLANQYRYIDKLNVFPVPDGDTGTNLKMTLTGALDYLNNLESMEITTKDYARGLLMNARGNSGAIFSQIFRGFAQGFIGVNELNDAETLIKTFSLAKEIGYKSVLAPVEGTILSVIRIVSEKVNENKSDLKTIEDVLKKATEYSKFAVNETPKMLKMLEEAKVVDSGGYGLSLFIEGLYQGYIGKTTRFENQSGEIFEPDNKIPTNDVLNNPNYGYCCEFILKLNDNRKRSYEKMKNNYSNLDSLVIIQDEDLIKVHLHSFDPGDVLSTAIKFGSFTKIKIDNMSLQAENKKIISEEMQAKFNNSNDKDKVKKISRFRSSRTSKIFANKNAIIATVPSKEIGEILKNNYNFDYYIDCKTHGNPSTQMFLEKIKVADAQNVFILIDNSNLILSAESAADLDKNANTSIINAKSIAGIFSAALVYNPNKSSRTNYKQMRSAVRETHSVLISNSIKNIKYGKTIVKKDDYIAIVDKEVIMASKSAVTLVKDVINKIANELNEVKSIQLICGTNSKKEEITVFEKIIKEKFPSTEIEFIDGQQDLYPYVIGIN